MSTLSTHVLDTARGAPARGIRVMLCTHGPAGATLLAQATTDADGRARAFPDLPAGRYSLTFCVADYFRATGVALADPPFLDEVPIHFGVAGDGHYHVPLLISPFAYSTYRGS